MDIQINVDQGPTNLSSYGAFGNQTAFNGGFTSYEDGQDPIIEEYNRQILGVEMGMETVQDLLRIKKVLEHDGEIDPMALKMAKIAIERHQERLKISIVTVGTESFSDRKVALEGIGSMLKAMVMAIINTLKNVFKAIMSLFKSEKKKTDNKKAEETVVTARKIIQSKKYKEYSEPIRHHMFDRVIKDDRTVIDLDYIRYVFFDLEKSIERLQEFLEGMRKVQNLIIRNIDIVRRQTSIDEPDISQFFLSLYTGHGGYMSQIHLAQSTFPAVKNHFAYEESLNGIVERLGIESPGTVEFRANPGFVNGRVLGALIWPSRFQTSYGSEMKELCLVPVVWNYKTRQTVGLDLHNAEDRYESLLKAMEGLNQTNNKFEEMMKKDFMDETLMNKMDVLANPDLFDRVPQTLDVMWLIGQYVGWTKQLVSVAGLVDHSFLEYRDVFEYITNKLDVGAKR